MYRCKLCEKEIPVTEVFFGYRLCRECLKKPLPSAEPNFTQRQELKHELSAEERAFLASQSKGKTQARA